MNRDEFYYAQQIGRKVENVYRYLGRAISCTVTKEGEFRLYEYFHDERVLRCADVRIQDFYTKVSKFYQQALEKAKQGEVE